MSKLLTVRLEDDLLNRLRDKAKKENKTMSKVIKPLIEGYLDGTFDIDNMLQKDVDNILYYLEGILSCPVTFDEDNE